LIFAVKTRITTEILARIAGLVAVSSLALIGVVVPAAVVAAVPSLIAAAGAL
jgi:hypothetical protein